MAIHKGQRYTLPDGSHVRVDGVANGQVYFLSWKTEQEKGFPLRMLITDFKIAIRNEIMILEEPTKLPVFDEARGRLHAIDAAAHPQAWHPLDDGAFAAPFGTIRKCLGCDCLVAGGPTRCGRCASGPEINSP